MGRSRRVYGKVSLTLNRRASTLNRTLYLNLSLNARRPPSGLGIGVTTARRRGLWLCSSVSWAARWFLALALLCQSSGAFAQVQNTGIWRVTGHNLRGNIIVNLDTYWSVQSRPNPVPTGAPLGSYDCSIQSPPSGWVQSASPVSVTDGHQWIFPLNNYDPATGSTVDTTLGTYIYQTHFTLPQYVDPNSVVLTGLLAASDAVTSLKLNGSDTRFAGAGSSAFVSFQIDRTNGSFHGGDNVLSVSVRNDNGPTGLIVDNVNITYSVFPTPVITSPSDPLYGSPGTAFSFSVQATNNPSYSAGGLPPGLTINSVTGEISGTPSLAGSFPVNVTAQNSYGMDAQTLILVISDWSVNFSTPPMTPITFGNGIFVGFGGDLSGNPLSYASTDGKLWSAHNSPPNLACVNFGNGIFLAGGQRGELYTSLDGVIWTSQTSGITNQLNGFAFGNNTYVGTSHQNSPITSIPIISSPDAQVWTVHQVNVGLHKDFYGVTFGSGTFVAVGSAGIYSSNDGTTWIQRLDQKFNSVAFGNGRFVAVGDAAAATSTDGQTWSLNPAPDSSSLTFGNNTFLTTTGSYSSDGALWLKTTLPVDPTLSVPPSYPNAIGFGNDTFVAPVGYVIDDNGNLTQINQGLTHLSSFPPGSIYSFGSNSYEVFENAGTLSVTIVRTGDLSLPVSVLCSTMPALDNSPGTGFVDTYTATPGVDYGNISQTVLFQPGENSKTVSIPIYNNNSSSDGRRELSVALTSQSDGSSVGTPAPVFVSDDDKSLQISEIHNLQDSLGTDSTVTFSADLIVRNDATTATGPLRIRMIGVPGYNLFHVTFDSRPLPEKVELGSFAITNSLAGHSTMTQPVTGVIPAPQRADQDQPTDGYVFWWAYAVLEEQAGGNWYPTPGSWPVDDGALLILTSSGGTTDCHHPPPGSPHCIDTGGGISSGGGGGMLPVLPPPPTLSGLNINGPNQVNKNSSTQYSVTGMLSDGTSVSPENVMWSATAFSISSTGVLSATSVKKDTPVTISASTTVAGVTQTSSLNVTVRKSKTALATPTISPNGGTFAHSVQVTISDAAGGATIRYTTNGSTPGKKSPVYSGPITLTSNATVNAIATASGASNSSVASAVFTITP